jgi:hypothetical protein
LVKGSPKMQLKWHKVSQCRCVAACDSCIESAEKNLAVQTKPYNRVYRTKSKITDVLSNVGQVGGTASKHGEEVCRFSLNGKAQVYHLRQA